MRSKAWWKGRRGEWYVVIQMALLLLLIAAPPNWPDAPAWPTPWSEVSRIAGAVLIVLGAALALFATFHLGRNLTPLPHPKDDNQLVADGAYGLVRHPIYSGIVLASFGWALCINGWLTLAYTLAILVFFDIKSRREERWLMERYPDYAAYRRRVRKLIPFLY